jgi:hypothetical protein
MAIELNTVLRSLAMYMAKEAGEYGNIELSADGIGTMAAVMTDVENTTADLMNNRITPKEAQKAYGGAILRGGLAMAVEKGAIDAGASFLVKFYPLSAIIVIPTVALAKKAILSAVTPKYHSSDGIKMSEVRG